MGTNLAIACMSIFGGNIALIQTCLDQLNISKDVAVLTILDGVEGANKIDGLLAVGDAEEQAKTNRSHSRKLPLMNTRWPVSMSKPLN